MSTRPASAALLIALEAADDYIDIQRIEFDATADAAGLLGRDEG